MSHYLLDQVRNAVGRLDPVHAGGRVCGVAGGTVQIGALPSHVQIGDRVRILARPINLSGEIVRLDLGSAHVLADGAVDGVSIGDRVIIDPPVAFAPDDSWIGRVIDPDGNPLDARSLLPGPLPRSLRSAPPAPHHRRGLGVRLETDLAVFNTLLPIVQGQRIGLFAGSGVGKSTLLGDLVRGNSADVIVIGLVGERGRELRHFVDDVLGSEGMAKSVIVAATSDRAPQVRRRCAWAAMTLAEHFRDAGKQVLLIIDSVTRFCEAHREVAVAAGEPANLRGYPVSTGAAIAGLCERAGPGAGDMGDITAVFSVLVAGSDMDEPVADMLRGVLDGHVVMDREIAERGRFPAIDVLRSVSRALPAAATPQENSMIAQARSHLAVYEKSALMIQAGLYAPGSDKSIDAAIACYPALDSFLTIKDGRGTLAHFAKLRQAMAGNGGEMKTTFGDVGKRA
ncbi:FliI/YscN family ATPase [Yoonia vestfoldensis]|uniref:FliI/YscN family ATPase n=1 Tax=Yoonia vestfoldensis TaxID=245188 RepID=UPI0003813070|nr:FliI/YscN family ATPase [Yoonia vestfoldensis]